MSCPAQQERFALCDKWARLTKGKEQQYWLRERAIAKHGTRLPV